MSTISQKKSIFNWFNDIREKISISAYLTGLITLIVIFITVLLSYQVFDILQENKYRDLTSIMFLELEKNVDIFRENISIFEKKIFLKTKNFTDFEEASVIFEKN